MLKKTIEFKDLDGNPVSEEFLFHLNKAEIAELELAVDGGLSAALSNIVATGNPGLIISTFKDLILKTVGRRSEDGRRFIKTQEIRDDFVQTDAYASMFMEIVTSATAAVDFVKGVMPADMIDDDAVKAALSQSELQPAEKNLYEYTTKEVTEMLPEEFELLTKKYAHDLPKSFLVESFRRRNL